MSIATAIENAQQKVENCYTSVNNMGGTLPATQNLSNLPAAIESISTGDTVTIAGSNVPENEKVLIRFDSSRQPYLSNSYNAYTYTGISNGDGTFKTALPDPLPYLQNYVINGNPTITDDYTASGWSSTNYVTTNYEPVENVDAELLIKAYWGVDSNVRDLCSYCALNYNGLFFYTDSWTRPVNGVSFGTGGDFWFRVRIINGIALGFVLKDNNYRIDTLPDLDEWIACTVGNMDISGNRVQIGYKYGANAWSGNIYLENCKIYRLNVANGTKELTWQLYSPFNITEQDTLKYIPSGDWELKQGQGTPVSTNKVLGLNDGLNGFNASDYVYPCAKTFRWNLSGAKSIYAKGHFKTTSSWASKTHQPILAYTTNGYSSPVTVYRNYSSGRLSGTFGDIIPISLATNTEYWFEATMDNQGNRVLKYSTDGINWTTNTETVAAPTWTDYTDVPCIGYWGNANFYWRGSIYDVECGYVDANDETHTFKLWK